MNIGILAAKVGIAPKTIRYYESIGLIPPAARSGNGYRVYSQNDARILLFIHRARALGFSLEEIVALLDFWKDRGRSSAQVRALIVCHIAAIDKKISELRSVRRTISNLVRCCPGDSTPECPILEELTQTQEMPTPSFHEASERIRGAS